MRPGAGHASQERDTAARRARWRAVNRLVPLILAGAGLAACSQPSPVAKAANNTGAMPATNHPTPHANASGAPPANRSETEVLPPISAGQAAPELPAAMRGRWGLTPMDCTSTRGDAKGLMIVGPSELRFYEFAGGADRRRAGRFKFGRRHFQFQRRRAKLAEIRSLEGRAPPADPNRVQPNGELHLCQMLLSP